MKGFDVNIFVSALLLSLAVALLHYLLNSFLVIPLTTAAFYFLVNFRLRFEMIKGEQHLL